MQMLMPRTKNQKSWLPWRTSTTVSRPWSNHLVIANSMPHALAETFSLITQTKNQVSTNYTPLCPPPLPSLSLHKVFTSFAPSKSSLFPGRVTRGLLYPVLLLQFFDWRMIGIGDQSCGLLYSVCATLKQKSKKYTERGVLVGYSFVWLSLNFKQLRVHNDAKTILFCSKF